MIVKKGSQYQLQSRKTHKNLGTYSTRAGAEKRERQVEYFKHLGTDNEELPPGMKRGMVKIRGQKTGSKVSKRKTVRPVNVQRASRLITNPVRNTPVPTIYGGKYYNLAGAAQFLGVEPAEVNQRVLDRRLNGSRNGNNWKFKVDEVRNHAADQGAKFVVRHPVYQERIQAGDTHAGATHAAHLHIFADHDAYKDAIEKGSTPEQAIQAADDDMMDHAREMAAIYEQGQRRQWVPPTAKPRKERPSWNEIKAARAASLPPGMGAVESEQEAEPNERIDASRSRLFGMANDDPVSLLDQMAAKFHENYWNTVSENTEEAQHLDSALQNGYETAIQLGHGNAPELETSRARDYWTLHTLDDEYPETFKKLFGNQRVPTIPIYASKYRQIGMDNEDLPPGMYSYEIPPMPQREEEFPPGMHRLLHPEYAPALAKRTGKRASQELAEEWLRRLNAGENVQLLRKPKKKPDIAAANDVPAVDTLQDLATTQYPGCITRVTHKDNQECHHYGRITLPNGKSLDYRGIAYGKNGNEGVAVHEVLKGRGMANLDYSRTERPAISWAAAHRGEECDGHVVEPYDGVACDNKQAEPSLTRPCVSVLL